MIAQFIHNFSFTNNDDRITGTLKVVKRVLYMAGKLIEDYADQDAFNHIYEFGFHEVVACGRINLELDGDDLEGLSHFPFKDYEGEWNVKDGPIIVGLYLQDTKLWKNNIGTKENPKLTSIRDYWDEQTTKEIYDLLREYEYLFPLFVVEIKWVKGELGEMNIMLNPDVRLVKH